VEAHVPRTEKGNRPKLTIKPLDFCDACRSYALATVRYPVLEVTATVEPFENARGFSLRIIRAGEPRKK